MAGPRGSKDPDIYDATVRILAHVFQSLSKSILAKRPGSVEEAVEASQAKNMEIIKQFFEGFAP